MGRNTFLLYATLSSVPKTTGIGAMVELADQFHRAFECMKVTIPVIADVHSASTDRAVAIKDVEFPQRKICILGPLVWHRADLHALVRSLSTGTKTRGYAKDLAISSQLSDY
jgi:hypothetical protein